MRIGLINIEPKIVNTAYMQIASFHRSAGHTVEFTEPLLYTTYDYLFCSSLFDYTDKSQVPDRAITGGTGFDLSSQLGRSFEESDYDYSLYPECDWSIVWFSRGCIRNCPWCVVPEKEGPIHPVTPKSLNPTGKYVVVQDNNFFANLKWRKAIDQLVEWGQPVDFASLDVRNTTAAKLREIRRFKLHKQIKFAWDDPAEDLLNDFRYVVKYFDPKKIMCYVLIGFNSTPLEDMYRVHALDELGVSPLVMAYDKTDPYQKAFARWVNRKEIFYSCTWGDYKRRPEGVAV